MSAASSARGRRRVRIGNYELVAPISGWGKSLYEAVDTSTQRDVVLKVLGPRLAGNTAGRSQCQRDAGQAARLNHRAVVSIRELGEANGTWYLTLEPLEATGLAAFVAKNGAMTEPDAARLVTQAAQALQAAHKLGIDFGDLTPSAFVIVGRGSGTSLKWLPLALLREPAANDADREAFRAPEQRRDPTAGGVRAAIYGLGALWVYLLQGRTPAATEPATGVHTRLPDRRAEILEKTLAAKPEERYATLAALVDDLVVSTDSSEPPPAEPEPEPAREIEPEEHIEPAAADRGARLPAGLEALAGDFGDGDATEVADDETDAMSEDTPVPRGRSRDQAPKPAAKRDSSKLMLLAGGGAALVLLIVAIVLLVTRDRHKSASPPGGNGQVKASPSPSPSPDKPSDGNPQIEDDKDKKKKEDEKVEPLPVWPPLLYEPKEPLDVKKLTAEFLEATAPLPKDTLEFHVSRLPASGKVSKNVKRFDSLSAACSAAPAGETTLIRIVDNGPLFETPINIASRSIRIEGGVDVRTRQDPRTREPVDVRVDFRPLIVWDVSKAKASKAGPGDVPPALLTVDKGSLWLQNVDLAGEWPKDAGGATCLVRAVDSEFRAWACTFSTAGKAPVSLIRLEGGGKDRAFCGLRHCFARGGNLTALDLRAASSDVIVDHCLLLGG